MLKRDVGSSWAFFFFLLETENWLFLLCLESVYSRTIIVLSFFFFFLFGCDNSTKEHYPLDCCMAEGSIILSGHTDVWSPDLVGSQDAHTEMMICSPAAQASWLPRSPVFGPRACSHHYPAKSCWHSLCCGWEALKEHGLNQWAPEICSSSHLAVSFFLFLFYLHLNYIVRCSF